MRSGSGTARLGFQQSLDLHRFPNPHPGGDTRSGKAGWVLARLHPGWPHMGQSGGPGRPPNRGCPMEQKDRTQVSKGDVRGLRVPGDSGCRPGPPARWPELGWGQGAFGLGTKQQQATTAGGEGAGEVGRYLGDQGSVCLQEKGSSQRMLCSHTHALRPAKWTLKSLLI